LGKGDGRKLPRRTQRYSRLRTDHVRPLSPFSAFLQYSCNASHRATQENSSCIINTGSKQGITTPPGNAVYNVSKSAVKTLTEQCESFPPSWSGAVADRCYAVAHELRTTPGSKCTAHLFMYVPPPLSNTPFNLSFPIVTVPDGSTQATDPEHRRNLQAHGQRTRQSRTCSISSHRGTSTSCARITMCQLYVPVLSRVARGIDD
jgi:hypothetical protein